jgi:predicted O-methyltransferase YrrM
MNYDELDKKARVGDFSTQDIEVIVPDLEKLKPSEIYLEVGVKFGKSLSIARMVTKPEVKVIGVDLMKNPKVEGTFFYQGDSIMMANLYLDGPISLLFIDGDHSYKGCKRDIDAWFPHVKKGGVIFFHDCDESGPGVMWAVAEFVCTHSCNFNLYKYNNKNTSMARLELT